MNLEPGTTVGPYRVAAHIATGSMGRVYRVEHVERGTTHAMKFLPLANHQQRERIAREADTLERLTHPNVVSLTEVVLVERDPALIMEYVEGPSLREWMGHGPHPMRQVERLFLGIVKGVAHAHRSGVIHRDLRPENVLLQQTPGGLVPKVLDFGLAKLLEPGERAALTHSDMSIGAAHYTAPEQITDPSSVDSRADIFSLGCLLYEMATGQRAFEGDDPLELMNAVAAGRYADPRELRPEISDRFHGAILGSLAIDPNRRLGDCETLLSVLGEGAAMTPVSAPTRDDVPPGRERSAPGPTSEVPWAWFAVGVLGVLVVGGLILWVAGA